MSARNGAGTGTVRIAILGAGRIAHTMADTLVRMAADERYASLIEPYAVATRDDQGRAQAFADRYGLKAAYGSYERLLADDEVDLVYIATPHSLHAEQVLQCVAAGKNTLVEKSFAANAIQTVRALSAAEEAGLLCTEAIWTRYMPSRSMITDLIDSGEIGTVHAVTANLAYPVTHKPRMTDPNLAGGALLDVGVYPLNFISMAVPDAYPGRIVATASLTGRGVDEQLAATLWMDNGIMGQMSCSMVAYGDRKGIIWGEKGFIVVENVNNPQRIDVFGADFQPVRSIDVPAQLTGYEYEVASAARAVLEGRGECAEMPHRETIRIMKLMDDMRTQCGIVYPFER